LGQKSLQARKEQTKNICAFLKMSTICCIFEGKISRLGDFCAEKGREQECRNQVKPNKNQGFPLTPIYSHGIP
jgi:hypothetical protein